MIRRKMGSVHRCDSWHAATGLFGIISDTFATIGPRIGPDLYRFCFNNVELDDHEVE